MEGAPACPFVAFGDDREGRSTSPDHRHRCFAESPEAPRALAHQEAYCLSSAFPVCPTFQDWARREAAHARGDGERPETAPTAVPAASDTDDPERDPGDDVGAPGGPGVRRNPPRDWAAPPPWATGAGGVAGGAMAAGAAGFGTAGGGASGGRAAAAAAAGSRADASAEGSGASGGSGSAERIEASELLAGRAVEGHGLAGSAADRLAGGASAESVRVPSSDASQGSSPSAGAPSASAHDAAIDADDELAGLVQRRAPAPPPERPAADAYPVPSLTGRKPPVSSTRPSGDQIPGPTWERIQRYEAYPTIRTRAGLPGVPRVAVLAGALVIAALALFMLPAFLGVGGGGPSSSASPSGSPAVATPSPTITPEPEPTPQVYMIREKDTLSKVANRFGIGLDELLAANPEIKNPDKISVGQQIIIPLPGGTGGSSASEAPAAS